MWFFVKKNVGIANESATGIAADGLSSLGMMEVDLPIQAKVRKRTPIRMP